MSYTFVSYTLFLPFLPKNCTHVLCHTRSHILCHTLFLLWFFVSYTSQTAIYSVILHDVTVELSLSVRIKVFWKKAHFSGGTKKYLCNIKASCLHFFDSAMDVIIKRRQPVVYCALLTSRCGYAVAATTYTFKASVATKLWAHLICKLKQLTKKIEKVK